MPATRPAPSPHTMTAPAAGAASRLAGTVASGTPPNAVASSGATPACAAIVTASGATSHRGPGSRALRRDARTTMPADAPTESWKPVVRTRNGSAMSRPVTASASNRSRDASRPSVEAVTASAAIADARSTDGSKRVTSAKNPMTASVATRRGRSVSRRSRGPARASTNATFSPETASRCESPAPRKSSATSTGWPRVSPSTKPRNRGRCRAGSAAAPRSSVARTPLAARAAIPPGDHAVTASTAMRPARCRRRSQSLPGGGRSSRPVTRTRWPAARRASAATAAGARAVASRCRPPSRRTSTLTPPPSAGSGPPSSVTVPVNGPGTTPTSPASARAASAPVSSSTASASAAGRCTASASTASATPTHGDGPRSSNAPDAAASATTTAMRSLIQPPSTTVVRAGEASVMVGASRYRRRHPEVLMVHTCPRCELRFAIEAELTDHLAVDHHADPERFERFRYKAPPVRPSGERYLVIANETLEDDQLFERLRQLGGRGAHFHLVAPAGAVDRTGRSDDKEIALATYRIRHVVDRLHEAGIQAEGEVGSGDPVRAAARALDE